MVAPQICLGAVPWPLAFLLHCAAILLLLLLLPGLAMQLRRQPLLHTSICYRLQLQSWLPLMHCNRSPQLRFWRQAGQQHAIE